MSALHAIVISLAILVASATVTAAIKLNSTTNGSQYSIGHPIAKGFGVWVIDNRTGNVRLCVVPDTLGMMKTAPKSVTFGCNGKDIFRKKHKFLPSISK